MIEEGGRGWVEMSIQIQEKNKLGHRGRWTDNIINYVNIKI